MKIEIIGTGMGPILSSKTLDELFFGTSTINKKNPLEEAIEAMDKLRYVAKEKDAVGKYSGKPICFDIQSITANHKKNAFTVVWGDGSHTIIHLQKGDVWDDEKALAMCFVKHMMGDKSNFNDIFTEDMPAKIKHIGKVEPVEEKHECKCSGKREESIHSCTKCNCKEESLAEEAVFKKPTNAFGLSKQAADELTKATIKADNSLKEMINSLTGETIPKIDGHYKVYIRIGGTSHHDSDFTSIKALRKRVHEIAEELYGRKPYYYRTWMSEGRMIIDFGHYTQFIEVEGITPDEYAKN